MSVKMTQRGFAVRWNPEGVPDTEVLRAALHDRLRPPGGNNRHVVRPANPGCPRPRGPQTSSCDRGNLPGGMVPPPCAGSLDLAVAAHR
jgi:hypothetical protein